MNDSETWKKCRWSEYAKVFFGEDWKVFFDASEDACQGTVEIMAVRDWPFGYKYMEYSYGSCSGCDPWEGEPEEKVVTEMVRCILPLSKEGALAHLQRIANSAKRGDDYDTRDRAKKAREALADESNWKDGF